MSDENNFKLHWYKFFSISSMSMNKSKLTSLKANACIPKGSWLIARSRLFSIRSLELFLMFLRSFDSRRGAATIHHTPICTLSWSWLNPKLPIIICNVPEQVFFLLLKIVRNKAHASMSFYWYITPQYKEQQFGSRVNPEFLKRRGASQRFSERWGC